jgi:hypothetical protein
MLRMAGNALRFLKNNMGASKGEVALRVLPDLAFGGLAASQTPGDMGDKLIAGVTTAVPSVIGGATAAGIVKKVGGGASIQNLADMAGSIGGDFGGMYVGDSIMRGKDMLMGGAGQTPYERMNAAQQQQLAEQMKQQMMYQYGLVPGTREQYAMDPSTGMGVA